jgi:hypothetical protein
LRPVAAAASRSQSSSRRKAATSTAAKAISALTSLREEHLAEGQVRAAPIVSLNAACANTSVV